MRYLSVCSGIEAASAAWGTLGWQPVAFAEIEPFPCAVLTHHYPAVPNLGDITRFKEWPDLGPIDVLVGGTPCQSFSVAGLRAGLADPRGNLALTYLAIVDRHRPRWVVWENVPGVLSSGEGRDFGAFLGGLGQLGYGFAYRVLDAQYVRTRGFPFAVPQRRRRVFVIGHLGDWRRAAAVLFDAASLRGDPPPGREKGEGIAPTLGDCSNGGGGNGPGRTADTADSLIAGSLKTREQYPDRDDGTDNLVAHALRADGFDASEDGTGRGTPLVADPIGANEGRTYTNEGSNPRLHNVVAFDMRGREAGSQLEGPHDTANMRSASGGSSRSYVAASSVRRLMPVECEKLQGFPPNYTLIPWRGKPAADGPRYKALGNSMAVNCMAWLGHRLALVEAMP